MGSKERFYADIMAIHPGVTGSCISVVVKFPDGKKTQFIVDCGLFQEKEYAKYNECFPFRVENVDFCLVTHCHVDHIGRLPLLTKQGFTGKIYMTETTAKFSKYALNDSYNVLREKAKQTHTRQLYSQNNVEQVKEAVEKCKFGETVYIDERTKVTFFSNGHLLGAALILVQLSYPGYEDINLLFTGDYNNKNMFFEVSSLPKWVYNLPLTIVQESTYGTMNSTEMKKSFRDNICRYANNGGSVVCTVFSLGRSQEILYVLKMMQNEGQLDKKIPIYFDGKLAHQYTRLYLEDELGLKEDMKDFLPENMIYVDKSQRMTVINDNEQKIIVTTSGMGTYGPAQIYIPEYIMRDNCLIQFTGYTADGTLGSKLKNTEIGDVVLVGSVVRKKRAEVAYTTEFSAHAKADEMIEFLKKFTNLKLVLVNHGEQDTKIKFSNKVVDEVSPKCVAILNRDYFFRVNPYGLVRSLSTKFE